MSVYNQLYGDNKVDSKSTRNKGGGVYESLYGENAQVATPQPAAPVANVPVAPAPTNIENPGVIGRGKDLALSLAQGVASVPEAFTGIADMFTGGRVGKASEQLQNKVLGGTTKDLRDYFQILKSEKQQAADKKVADATGFKNTAKTMLQNPSTIVSGITQAVPSMFAGGAIAKALKYAPKLKNLSPLVRGAIGEASISAGMTATDARQNNADGNLSLKESATSFVSGALTGTFGVFGGKVANRLGVGDIDTILAGGMKLDTLPQVKSAMIAALKGAISESVFEELPQSMQEQIASNLNNGRPWDAGVLEAGAQGMLTAIPMGGAVSGIKQLRDNAVARNAPPVLQNNVPLPPPENPFVVTPGVPPIDPPVMPPVVPEMPPEAPVVAPPVEVPTQAIPTPTPEVLGATPIALKPDVKPLSTKGGKTITLKGAKGTDGTKTSSIEVKGETVITPKQTRTKTELATFVKSLGETNVTFTVAKNSKGKKVLTYSKGSLSTEMIPGVLGLSDNQMNVGDTVNVDLKNLKETGATIRGYDDDGEVLADKQTARSSSLTNTNSSTKEDEAKLEQQQKLGRMYAIPRKLNTKTGEAGSFHYTKNGKKVKGIGPRGQIYINKNTAEVTQNYASTLSHEIAHSLDKLMNPNFDIGQKTYTLFGENLEKEKIAAIDAELRAVTNKLVGESVAMSDKSYYYSRAELFARFIQLGNKNKQQLEELAPNAYYAFQVSRLENPVIDSMLKAMEGTIDEGQLGGFLTFGKDMRETYHHFFGKAAGDRAYNLEQRKEKIDLRTVHGFEKLLAVRFKNIKDDKATLYRAVEAIHSTKNGEIRFGTNDVFSFKEGDTKAINQAKELKNWERVYPDNIVDGKIEERYIRVRYTEEQAKALYSKLSPEGKEFVKEFTTELEEFRKNYKEGQINRDNIKHIYGVSSQIEGWMHRMYENDKDEKFASGNKMKNKVALASMARSLESSNKPGRIEDIHLSLLKGMVNLQQTKDYNDFVEEFAARVTEPLLDGQKPKEGWIEVTGGLETGIGSTNETPKQTIYNEKTGKSFLVQRARWQMPTVVYKRFELIKGVVDEASTGMQVARLVNKFWMINILGHMGTTSTNIIGGALQMGVKISDDFWLDAISLDPSFTQTRINMTKLITTLYTPNWREAEDWMYGGNDSNLYGQMMSGKQPNLNLFNNKVNKGIDKYGDVVLKLFGTVERFFKKVVVRAEGGQNLGHLSVFNINGFPEIGEVEKAILDMIEAEADRVAFNYENVPVVISDWSNNPITSSIKPFLKYPYKFIKLLQSMVNRTLDGTLTPQERYTSLMTILTISAVFLAVKAKSEEEEKTEQVGEKVSSAFSKDGRMFVGKNGNKERFLKVSKYPFLNIGQGLSAVHDKDYDSAKSVLQDMFGSVGPGGQIAAIMMGFKDEYNTYTPVPVIAGNILASFIPLGRMLTDAANYQDPYKRKKETFMQSITSSIPLPGASKETLEKYRGKARTADIPVEGNVRAGPGDSKDRTTTTRYIRENKNLILWAAIAGFTIKEIDPEVARAFIIRERENAIKAKEEARKKKNKVIH